MTIEPISRDQLAQISTLFQVAFIDDPGLQHICDYHRKGYERRLYACFEAILKMQMANKQPVLGIRVNSECVACAILTYPNTKLKLHSTLHWTWLALSQTGFRCFWRTVQHIIKISPHQPKYGHYRLEFIAVHPDYQGKGYGRMLLDEIHQMSQSDSHSQGVWLETTLPQNIGLYVHVGYVIEKRLMMTDDVEAVIMFRRNA